MENQQARCSVAVAAWLLASALPSGAQSIGYAGAVGQLGANCGADIGKYCGKVNLAGGRITQCLEQNRAAISARCKASISQMQSLLAIRAQARAAVPKLCDADIRRLCSGVQAGDGNLMECFSTAKQRFSPQCQKAVADAGYEATTDASASTTQVALSSTDLINSLQGVEQVGRALSAASLRQMAAQATR